MSGSVYTYISLSTVPMPIGVGRRGRDCYRELRRIPIPRTPVNKALSDALGSLEWHHTYGWHGGALTERHCRNCGHELAETDRFCPNCGTPVHQGAHVPTPEADVDVPLPPQQAGATTTPPDAVEGREDFPVVFFTVV